MIEIDGNTVRISDINKLLIGNPVDAIFESLNIIWQNSQGDDFYTKGEALTSKFEKQVYRIYPEIYDVILHNIERNTTIKEILEMDGYCLIIMDGMSLRETNLIIEALKPFGHVKLN